MKILLAVVAVLAVIIYFMYPIIRARKISGEIEKTTVAYEQHPTESAMRILVVGDSTGVGTGAGIPEESIAGRLGHDYPNADIQNISENGIKIDDVRKKLYALPEAHYDLILIQIGANDVTGFTSKNNLAESLHSVLDYAESRASSTVVVTAGNIGRSPVFHAPLSAVITQRTLAVRDIFKKDIATRTSVTYVDLFKPEMDDLFSSNPGKYYARDSFHPSSDGYGEWYREIRTAIK